MQLLKYLKSWVQYKNKAFEYRLRDALIQLVKDFLELKDGFEVIINEWIQVLHAYVFKKIFNKHA